MKKTIEITIGPDGQISVETSGFKGTFCHKATKAMEEALGEVQSRKRTAEFFQTETATNQQRLGQ